MLKLTLFVDQLFQDGFGFDQLFQDGFDQLFQAGLEGLLFHVFHEAVGCVIIFMMKIENMHMKMTETRHENGWKLHTEKWQVFVERLPMTYASLQRPMITIDT